MVTYSKLNVANKLHLKNIVQNDCGTYVLLEHLRISLKIIYNTLRCMS